MRDFKTVFGDYYDSAEDERKSGDYYDSAEDERKSRIKDWRRNRRSARSLLPAHLPAGRRFGDQPPAVRAALGPEM